MIAPAATDAQPVQKRRVCDCEYEGLSGTFAAACREADGLFQLKARKLSEHPGHQADQQKLAQSTIDALKYMLSQNDAGRLDKFLCGRSHEQIKLIKEYIRCQRG
jgi:hypothetical protein